ncbi:MAG TPA: LysE family transporter [Kofleriaceae bacterium]|nr:LysE family transporter [Kofleriaceae bacterium]
MIELVTAGAVGLALGAVTGLPLGVVNVAIVEAAARRGVRAASGIAVGGALADMVHAGLAAGGIGHAIVARPAAAATLHLVAGAVLVGYAVVLWRNRPTDGVARELPATFSRGVLAGLGFTLPNPAALGAWIAVAAALAPPSVAAGLVGAAGVGVGSAAWFLLLARLAADGAAARSGAVRRGLTRGVAIVLAALGCAAIARGVL